MSFIGLNLEPGRAGAGARWRRGVPFGTKPALNKGRAAPGVAPGSGFKRKGTIDAVFAPYRRVAERPILRLGGNAWPLERPRAANRCRSDLHPPIHGREQHRDVSLKENHMSSISNLTSAASALPTLNIHPHGHKKGSQVGSADDSSSNTAAQAPAGTVQNLFGTLLQSLEQVIGLQPSTGTAATAATATTGAGASTTAAAASTGAATASTQSASTLLQNYLNNLSQNLRANGSQTPRAAGSTVSVDA